MQDMTVMDDDGLPTRRTCAAPFGQMAQEHLGRVADVIAGHADEIELDQLILAAELFCPQMQTDHMRLIRAASLAIQYLRENPWGHSQSEFYKRVARVFQVDAEALKSYVLVLEGEIRHRERTGSSPLSNLPRLIKSAQEFEELDVREALALPPPMRFKHDPSEYVSLAEQGLNNTEIAKYLGDVSEAAVRRGLAAAGYERRRTWIEETEEEGLPSASRDAPLGRVERIRQRRSSP